MLKKHGFGAFKKALRDADRAALLGLLAADFRGEELDGPREIALDADYVRAVREEEVDGRPRRPLGRDEFVGRLLDYRRRFAGPPEMDMALMTLAPENPGDDAGPWKGEVQLRLWGDAPGKIRLSDQLVAGPAAGGPRAEVILTLQFRVDAPDEDALPRGGWLHGCAIRQAVTEQAPQFLFQDVTARRGIDARQFYDNWTRGSKPLETVTGGVYLTDFDRDGCLDMLVVDLNRVVLYKGLPDGRFADVTAAAGLPPRAAGLAAAFADLDGDGWEDLLLGGRVYRNVPDGGGGRRFEDATAFSSLHIPLDATGIAVCDYDRDGCLDVYVTRPGQMKASSWVDGTGAGAGNQLWHNTGQGLRFEDVTEQSGTSGDHRSTFSAVWLDADNDGWPDLYAINEFGNGVLLLNNHDGTFREKQLADGPADFGSMGLTCGDVDNDGNIDIFVNGMYSKAGSRIMANVPDGAYPPRLMAQMRRFVTGSQLWMNRGGSHFEPKAKDYKVAAVGWAYGAALVDLDNDGWLDLYATAGFVSEDRSTPDG